MIDFKLIKPKSPLMFLIKYRKI